jgi:hypothetical protein
VEEVAKARKFKPAFSQFILLTMVQSDARVGVNGVAAHARNLEFPCVLVATAYALPAVGGLIKAQRRPTLAAEGLQELGALFRSVTLRRLD